MMPVHWLTGSVKASFGFSPFPAHRECAETSDSTRFRGLAKPQSRTIPAASTKLSPLVMTAVPPVVQALTGPGNWIGPVELIETHISWVFLAGEFVYKVKKPVDLGFLDF